METKICTPYIQGDKLHSEGKEVTARDCKKCNCINQETCYWICCLLSWDRIEEAKEKYNKKFIK